MLNNVPNAPQFPEIPPGFRLVPARIGRPKTGYSIAYILCPTICNIDHVASPEGHLEDVVHRSDDVSLFVDSFVRPNPVQAWHSSIQLDMASDDRRLKRAHIIVTDEDVDAYLTPEMAEQVADETVRWAAQLRQQARTVRAFNGDSDVDVDEALRRVREGGGL